MLLSAVAPLAATKSSGGIGSFLPLILIVVVIFFFMSQRRRMKAQQQQQAAVVLDPGTRVITTSGMHGTVVGTVDGDVLLEVAPDVVLRFSRPAVARVLPDEDDPRDEIEVDPPHHVVDLEKPGEDEPGTDHDGESGPEGDGTPKKV